MPIHRDILMALGPYRFAVSTAAYQQLVRRSQYRWAQQDRIGRRPALQYLGPGMDEIEVRGVIYPFFRGGLGQVNLMRNEAGRGTPHLLVTGYGDVLDTWAITEIEETEQHHTAHGIPRRIDFRLTLQRYGEDEDDDSILVQAGDTVG